MSNYPNDFASFVFGCLVVVATVFIIGLILALPVMWLWNWLMPSIFGLTSITWIQAWGINILCGFLFKPTVNVNKS